MDYTHLLNELNEATLFDLYRLHVAMGKELDNPSRIKAIQKKLYLGMELTYFHSVENRTYPIRLLEVQRKKVVGFDVSRNTKVAIPYCMLNLEGVETSIHEKSDSLNANNLKVGDHVGFHHEGKDIIGVVKRLNSKTVTLIPHAGGQWRVGYNHLYRVHDTDHSRTADSKQIIYDQ